jgi:hypothetical protein
MSKRFSPWLILLLITRAVIILLRSSFYKQRAADQGELSENCIWERQTWPVNPGETSTFPIAGGMGWQKQKDSNRPSTPEIILATIQCCIIGAPLRAREEITPKLKMISFINRHIKKKRLDSKLCVVQ